MLNVPGSLRSFDQAFAFFAKSKSMVLLYGCCMMR